MEIKDNQMVLVPKSTLAHLDAVVDQNIIMRDALYAVEQYSKGLREGGEARTKSEPDSNGWIYVAISDHLDAIIGKKKLNEHL